MQTGCLASFPPRASSGLLARCFARAFAVAAPLFCSSGISFPAPVVALGVASLVASCAKPPAPKMSSAQFEAKAMDEYKQALKAFHDRDWVSIPTLMGDIKREYAGTRAARLAQLRIADAQFHQKDYPEAITSYREFLREFPNDPEVIYARYRVAECQFEARGDSVTSPPLEERDLVNVRDADRTIESFLHDYPQHKNRERLLYMQTWVRGMLARHELYVARYYLARDELKAAAARTQYSLSHYKNTGLEAEALVLLGETRMKQRLAEQAAEAFYAVLDQYPDSPFTDPAARFLQQLKTTHPEVVRATQAPQP